MEIIEKDLECIRAVEIGMDQSSSFVVWTNDCHRFTPTICSLNFLQRFRDEDEDEDEDNHDDEKYDSNGNDNAKKSLGDKWR